MNDDLEQAAQTAAEHGAAAAAAAGGAGARARPSRPAALEPDTPEGACANCETDLQGPVCHNCGQVADEYHRPVRGLLQEMIEGLTALDGRVARTLPNLLLRPGRVTRAYLKGARARFMPPFRLYIIASLIFFLLMPALDRAFNADGLADIGDASSAQLAEELDAAVESGELTPEEAASALETLERVGAVVRPPAAEGGAGEAAAEEVTEAAAPGPGAPEDDSIFSGPAIDVGSDGEDLATPDAIRHFFVPEDFGEPAPDTIWPLALRRHFGERFAQVQGDPGGWLERAAQWVPRIMFVMVPVYALLLSLTYAWRRRFFFYDHLIVSLHFHSALFLTASALSILSGVIGAGLAWFVLLIYSNVYLYRLQRVVYARGRFASVMRTLTLDALYFIALFFGFIAVLLLGALV
ncbi:MAG: DUF3667 domain-containing protein [Oceanicaulis sp.]